jgi:hypothetical protein
MEDIKKEFYKKFVIRGELDSAEEGQIIQTQDGVTEVWDWVATKLDKEYERGFNEGRENEKINGYSKEVKQPIKETLRPLNSVMQICPICGKVDAYKGDNHSCEQHIQQQELED